MKNWTWKEWGMVIAFSVILLLAVVFLILGITTHEEPGLMGACWTGDSVSRYEVNGASECPELTWESAPLIVAAQTTNPHPPAEPEGATHYVVRKINTRLGFDMLVFESGGCERDTDICVNVGEAHEVGSMDENGDVTHSRDGDQVRCTARTINTGTSEMLTLVLEHELGHCIGLAHDSYEVSIMRENQEPVPDRSIPPWISDHDRNLLKELYE